MGDIWVVLGGIIKVYERWVEMRLKSLYLGTGEKQVLNMCVFNKTRAKSRNEKIRVNIF